MLWLHIAHIAVPCLLAGRSEETLVAEVLKAPELFGLVDFDDDVFTLLSFPLVFFVTGILDITKPPSSETPRANYLVLTLNWQLTLKRRY